MVLNIAFKMRQKQVTSLVFFGTSDRPLPQLSDVAAAGVVRALVRLREGGPLLIFGCWLLTFGCVRAWLLQGGDLVED